MQALSQSLAGIWHGNYSFGAAIASQVRIDLELIATADSGYKVYSHTFLGKNLENTCLVKYERISADSIYLEEVEEITKVEKSEPSLLQKFILKISHSAKLPTMSGYWETDTDNFGKAEFWLEKPKSRGKKGKR